MREAKVGRTVRSVAGLGLVVGAALVGCGTPRHPVASVERATATNRSDEWGNASWEDRHDTMTFAVLPTLGRKFQRFYGSKAPTLTCQTCHGRTAEAVAYKMPNGLAPLDPAHMPRFDDPDPSKARIAKFMFDEVTPMTADLIGAPPYDPATGRGFGCFNCHEKVGTPR